MGVLNGYRSVILLTVLGGFMSANSPKAFTPVVVSPVENRWELTDDEDGIKFYVRWVALNSLTEVRERKVEILAHTSLDKALGMVIDIDKASLWMSGIKRASLLQRDNSNQWYSHVLYGLPWPFNDREMITLCRMKKGAASSKITISMESVEHSYPKAKGVERLTNYKASWEIVEINHNLVKMTFIALSGDPPAFPRVIQDPLIKRVFMGNMRCLKELLEKG